jgi:hypothetical protein
LTEQASGSLAIQEAAEFPRNDVHLVVTAAAAAAGGVVVVGVADDVVVGVAAAAAAALAKMKQHRFVFLLRFLG